MYFIREDFGPGQREVERGFLLRKRNFDEIDQAGFGAFVRPINYYKRNIDKTKGILEAMAKKNFDEIDRAGFGYF